MSLTPVFADGGEQYTTAADAALPAMHLWDSSGSATRVGTNYGRFGSIGFTTGTTFGTSPQKTLPSGSLITFGLGVALYPLTSSIIIIATLYDAAGTAQGLLQRNADGSVSVYRGAGTTLLGTSAAAVLPTAAYHHLEAQCKIDPSAGTWDVWIDRTCVLSLNALNTRGSSVVGSGVAKFSAPGSSGTAFWFDDIHAYDAGSRTGSSGAGTPASSTFEQFGDKRIQTLFPSGAGTGDVNPSNWAQTGGTGGSPYTAVNERPQDGNTSYLADANAGDIKSFALDDLAPGTTGVVAIFPTACFEKDDATARSCAIGIRTSSTNAFGSTITSPSAYAYSQVVRTTDGAGAALTAAGINGSEILFKVVS